MNLYPLGIVFMLHACFFKHVNTAQNPLKDAEQGWKCTLVTDTRTFLYMRYPDRVPYGPYKFENQSDIWFDRLIYIHHEGRYDYINTRYHEMPQKSKEKVSLSVTINGVILDNYRVLTSFNPFRDIVKYAFKRQFTHVCVMIARICYDQSIDYTRFKMGSHNIECARQVVPLEETLDMEPDMWFGKPDKAKGFIKQHTPIHDLMVLRTGSNMNATDENEYDWQEYLKKSREFVKEFPNAMHTDKNMARRPVRSFLAKKGDVIGSKFKFAMMGHIFSEVMKEKRNTYVGYFNASQHALANCDAWLPREWGHFICINNIHKIERLASGAVLYSKGLVFGIGSFTLYKGQKSILVFTDVREYEHLINGDVGTCTEADQADS